MTSLNALIRKIRPNSYLVFVMLFSLALIVINYIWIKQDIAPPPWDQAWYLQNTQILYQSWMKDGLLGLVKSFSHALGGSKAPLISILPLPFYLLFGNSEMAAMFVNFSFLLLLSYFLFQLVRHLINEKVALLSVLITQTMPLFVGMNRQFFVEYGMATIVIMYLYFLVKSDHFQKKAYNIGIGILLGFGMLMKVIFPLYVFLPSLWILYLKKKNNKGAFGWPFFRTLLMIFLIGFVISSVWYLPNIKSVIAFGLSAGFGDIAANYGSTSIFSWDVIYGYWRILVNISISSYYFKLLVVSVLGSLGCYFFFKNKEKLVKKGYLEIILLWFFVPFILLTFSVNKDYRFMLPVFPVISIFISLAVNKLTFKLKNNVVYGLIALLLITIPLSTLYKSSFTDTSIPRDFKTMFTPDTRDWKGNEIVEYVYRETYKMENPSAWSMVAFEHPSVNFNTYNYIASRQNYTYPLGFGNLGFTQTDFDSVMNSYNYISPNFILVQDGIQTNELVAWANVANDKIREMIETGELPYVKDKEFGLSHGVKLTLFKKSE